MGNKLFETDLAKLRTDFEYDTLYRVKEKRLPETNPATSQPYRELFAYDKVGNRTSFTDANGKVTTSEYDGLNRLIRTVRDPLGLGLESTVTYLDPEGSKVNKSEEHDVQKGLRTLYAYDPLNRETLRTVKLEGPDGDALAPPEYVTATTYEDANHAMTVVDPRGTEIFRRMNGRDQLVEEVVDAGSSGLRLRTTMAYDGLGNRRRVTDPRGSGTLYDFDGLGRLRTMSDALRQDTTYEYDGEGLKTAETDRRGVKRRFTYDNLGRPLRTALLASITAVPWSQEVEYRDQQLQRVETDGRGHKTTYDLDKLGRVVRITDPDNKLKTLAYDGVNKVSESDKRGHVTLFAYDAVNRLVKVTDPVPFQLQTVTTTYEDAANRVTEKDRRGTLRVTQLDPLGRTRSVTRASTTLERHEYDGNGNRLRSLDADNQETRFAYDPANRLSARTEGFFSPVAATTTFKYDQSGNPTEERDPRATALGEPFSIRRTYDELNRLTSMVDGEGNVSRYSYDGEGNKILETEPNGQKTAYEYEEQGKLTKVTQPEVEVAGGVSSPITRHAYDPARNRIRQTDANGHVVEMAYDKLNRMTTMTQDGGGLNLVTAHAYDPNGNEKKLTDPKGQVATSTYDELDRLKTKDYAFAPSDPVRPWRHTTGMVHTYDANSNLVQVDEAVASGTDPPGTPPTVLTTLRTHDDLDRLTSETSSLPDGGSKTVAYTYNLNGTRKTVTDPEGLVSSYSYDAKNRLQSMTTAFGTPQAKTTGYSYEPDDLLKTVDYPNGVVATHQYDKADRLTSLTNVKPAQPAASAYVHTYDLNGNRTKQVETNGLPTPTVETTTYTYDALNRLASVNYPDKRVGYGYDLVGNRTSEIEKDLSEVVLANKVASFDAVNRLTSIADSVAPANSASFTWDPNGNQLTRTTGGVTSEYRYDVRDKLVEAGQGAAILGRFQYDFEGRRNKKIGEEGIRQYVYDDTSLLTEYDSSGAPKAKYDYGDRLISLFRQDEGRRYFHLDGLRSVVNLTDDLGAAKAAYNLDAWGQYRFPTQLDASKNCFGFTGHLWDRETSLLYAKARYLDPEIGRFISQDSYLGEGSNPPSLHRYFYANANPTTFLDPTGHFSIKDVVKGAVNVVLEPFRQVYDVGLSVYARQEGLSSEQVQLTSILGKAQQQRVNEGQGTGTAAAKGVGETAFAVGTVGIGPAVVSHVQLAQAFDRGEITIDQYDAALSEMAGGQVAAAAIAKVAGGRSGARAGTELQVQPKGAGAVRIIEGNRGATALPEGPVIEMVPTGQGAFVPAFEAQGGSAALTMSGQPAGLIGPGAQPRALLAAASLNEIIASNYQRYYNDAAGQIVRRFNQGEITVPAGVKWNTVLGQEVDAAARARLRNFLTSQGIPEGAQEAVRVNRWLRDPSGSGKRRVPDVMLGDSRRILDGTIGRKALTDPQATDFVAFSGGYSVTFVTPQLGPLSKLSK